MCCYVLELIWFAQVPVWRTEHCWRRKEQLDAGEEIFFLSNFDTVKEIVKGKVGGEDGIWMDQRDSKGCQRSKRSSYRTGSHRSH